MEGGKVKPFTWKRLTFLAAVWVVVIGGLSLARHWLCVPIPPLAIPLAGGILGFFTKELWGVIK